MKKNQMKAIELNCADVVKSLEIKDSIVLTNFKYLHNFIRKCYVVDFVAIPLREDFRGGHET